MSRYLVQRLLGMAVGMFIVVTVVFLIVRVTPGDPAAIMLGPDATAAEVAALRDELGLNQPILVQYVLYLGQMLRGDLGQSIFLDMPVLAALGDRAEPTLFLTLFAILIAAVIAVPIGILAAYRRGSAFDQVVATIAMMSASIPSFWLGLMAQQMIAVKLGLLPVAGYGPPGAGFLDRMQHLLLPAAVLGVVSSALILRFTRASMLDVLNDDYVRTARAKGLSEFTVVMKHAFKNALIPVITILGITFAMLISGAVVTENVFNLPGVGNLVVSAVLRRDYPVIQGALLVVAGLYVLINFLIDMLYMLVDPRVKY